MYEYEYPHPAVTTDSIVFTVRDASLQVLLIERGQAPYKGQWAFPGGFIEIDEDLEACARRELQEETGLVDVPLQQLYTVGTPDRDPRERVISVIYYALVPTDQVTLTAADDAADADWFALDDLPPLAFDHADILPMAHERLCAELDYARVARQFMPAEFTLTELQQTCELILRAELDSHYLRTQIVAPLIAAGQIAATGDKRRGVSHSPAEIFRMIEQPRVTAAQ